MLPPGDFCSGRYPAAYAEYTRAAKGAGREIRSLGDENIVDVAVAVHIRPNSPTVGTTPHLPFFLS